jgi:outer membrane protein OmpA-like peptidoglycan-associated protein
MRINKYSIFIIIFFAAGSLLIAQTDRTGTHRLGLFLHAGSNGHFAKFGKEQGVNTCCREFTDGDGSGHSFGFSYNYNITDKFMVGVATSIVDLSGSFNESDNVTIIFPDRFVNAKINYDYESNIQAFGIMPRFSYNFFDNLNVHFGTGLYFLTNATYEHHEELISPYGKPSFVDSSKYFNDFNGDIEKSSVSMFMTQFGFSYDIYAMSDQIAISPEMYFTMGLTPVAEGFDWRIGNVRMGINAQYIIPGTEIPLIPLSAFLKIEGINDDGSDEIVIEKYNIVRSLPLLNFVFFDKDSAEIPDRYNLLTYEDTKQFIEEDANTKNALTAYYDVLNIIGRRMTAMKDATITLTGCNSSDESQVDKLSLSMKRADRIYEYLTNVWQIDPIRIKRQFRNAPMTAIQRDKNYGSDIDIDKALLENDRVEITSNNWGILAPIMITETSEKVKSRGLAIDPVVSDSSGISNYVITLSQEGKLIDQYAGLGTPDRISIPIENYPFIDLQKPITYVVNLEPKAKYRAANLTGDLMSDFKTIPKDKIYYSIIWNDFDNPNVDRNNNQLLKILKNKINPSDRVTIDSYTDKLGFKGKNSLMSKYRANAVAKNLGLGDPKINAHGESIQIYDSDLPEANFYNRTVNIIIESPETDNE